MSAVRILGLVLVLGVVAVLTGISGWIVTGGFDRRRPSRGAAPKPLGARGKVAAVVIAVALVSVGIALSVR